jgi:capsular polysaccharide transport system ATP-binding protein
MVSHSNETIREFCDYAGVLSRGQLTIYDTVEDAITVHTRNMSAPPSDNA